MHDRGQGVSEVALFERCLQIDRMNIIVSAGRRYKIFSHGA
ncbi:hypothetical protein SZ54_0550 [Rhizobium sp. UR51a]|nr:hypothetical protein SZ54_0550 [Rhizobium sp. UR51a]